MVSRGKKPSNSGTSQQISVARPPPLKQRTLFDSFARVPSNTATSTISLSKFASGSSEPIPPTAEVNSDTDHIDTRANGIQTIGLQHGAALAQAELSEDEFVEIDSVTTLRKLPPLKVTCIDLEPDLGEMPSIEGRSRDRPIIIASSPIKPASIGGLTTAKPAHPFFLQRLNNFTAGKSILAPSNQPRFKTPGLAVPYPDESSQHIKGTQSSYNTVRPLPRKRPITKAPTHQPHDYAFLRTNSDNLLLLTHSSPAEEECVDLDDNTDHCNNHQAIRNLLDVSHDERPSSTRPWSEKWRPACAGDVLGNELSAIYLRNWLQALELQLEGNPESKALPTGPPSFTKKGIKRPRVIRTVVKSRKKARSEDDWIVDTDDDESEDDVSDDFDFDQLDPSAAFEVLNQRPSTDINEFGSLGQLHNTILISGPSGSGKTAAVYACADELGWEVFEVYPGVGKRSGGNVDNLIGEVGKNHLVRRTTHASSDLKSICRSKDGSMDGTAYSPRKKLQQSSSPSHDPNPVRQSLILLEEVDVLFKEDVNFWNTISRIIKECKRPVVCTCNDISLVPVAELPLQTILVFESCPVSIACSYLQALSRAEGHPLERRVISGLLENTQDGHQKRISCDLRKAINHVQLFCSASEPSRPVDAFNDIFSSPLSRHLRLSTRQAESFSFLDGCVSSNLFEWMETRTEFADYIPSNDDEIGYTILSDPCAKDVAQFSLYDRHREITSLAYNLTRGMHGINDNGDVLNVEEAREKTASLVGSVIEEVCPPSLRSMVNTESMYLEYMPIIRQIVEKDDELEGQSRSRGGRRTRNSGHVRTIELTEKGRECLGWQSYTM